ncbi:Ig-like domain-containing protein [Kitasatospora sp. NBC_01287]|uniref:L,D-transpeptidase n=1 Tax=Kitasatospora sp. NBC_01287 TaxID=2903573 RepID=UPI00224DDFD6|nr:Ig-like domain-containing protein [Kitasatospora sp. NBC_01287]MCX4747572.1 Ig-like domain-containing protein [Kitasatospora sp. NBC_01287]
MGAMRAMQAIRMRPTGRRAGTALLLGGVLLLATACGSGGGSQSGGGANAGGGAKGNGPAIGAPAAAASSAAPKTSAAVVDVEPKNGSQDVAPNGALKVSVADGKLTEVAVTGPDGKAVQGAVAADGLSWAPAGGLAVGAAYTVEAKAVDANGVATSTSSSFTTLTPKRTTRTVDNISTGSTYGVGMIIRVDFRQKVTNKAAAAQAITVEASDGTQVKGHWLDDDNWLDLRPESYWKPGTKVTIHYRTSNVELSPGVYGNSDRDESFTIGRSKISTVDAKTHQMNVVEDGLAPQTIAVTAGADDNPSWNGTMVVFEKDRMAHMDSATTNIKGPAYVADEPHALKITDSGSYVHGNPKAVEAAGHENISHGCIGLPDTPTGDDNSVAGKYYTDSIIGDVVIVKNSVGGQVAPDNGLGGWNVPWSTW